MPIYEYTCKKCEKEVTVVRKIEDREKTFKCTCGSRVKRKPEVPAKAKIIGGTPRFY